MSSSNEYMRTYMLARYHRRRTAAIAFLGGRCVKCGSEGKLEFDHVVPRSKAGGFTIGKKIASVAESKLMEEIARCQLLCGECHREKTLADLNVKRAKGVHGSLTNYRRYGCRCEPCRKAGNASNAKIRKARKQRILNFDGEVPALNG